MTRRKDYHKYIDSYMDKVRSGEILASSDLIKAMDLIENRLDDPDVEIRSDMIEKADELITRYFYKFFDWELFVLALVHCYYKSTDTVVFDEFLLLMGTGSGKNGFISALAWYFTTHYHGISRYNVEIIANSEEQAKTSFIDIYEVLEDTWSTSRRFFYKTKEIIRNTKTKSTIKYNTSNARTRLGKRAACLIFDEILEYEDWVVFNAFNASFGKKKHSRKFFITTQGYVRQGFLDDQLDRAQMVLNGEIDSTGFLPLLYKLDDEKEVHNKSNWVKANPSLPHFPELQKTLDTEYENMKHQPQLAIDFMTKRMNLPREEAYTVVAPWEKIQATNKPIPYDKLEGKQCIGAIDYAQITDFASCGLLFKYKGMRYWIEHSFVCHLALKVESRRIKFPVQQMADEGLLTIIRDDSISSEYIASWFLEQAKKYHIIDIAADAFRASLLQSTFQTHGLPLSQVRSGPATHAKVAPLIESMFAEEKIVFGDNPTMRWYVNNTYQELDGKGNITYKKIEPKTRKTDGFFALIHALSKDGELPEARDYVPMLDVYTY